MMESMFLALLFTCLNFTVLLAAQTQLIGSHQPIIALVGDDVLLPCHLEPAVSLTYETVVWTKAGLKPKYVHYHQDGRLLFEKQDPLYSLRTRLFMDELQRGNVSLKIFEVEPSDAGTYKCSLPAMKKEAEVELIVGQSDVIGSDQPVKVLVSDDIILPCHLEPPLDVTTLSVEWRRGPALVHVYRNRRDDPVSQDQNFKGRTSLFQDEMTRGNISLKLTDVTEQDAGNYTCSVPKLQRSSVTLVVEPQPARGEKQTLPKTRQSSYHSTVSDDEEKQFLRPHWTDNSITNKLTIEMAEVHGKEEKILQQQNINMRRIHSSPAIFDIRLPTGLCYHDQSTTTNSSPTSGNFLQNKDPNRGRLKCQHLSESTLFKSRFTHLAFLD
ncbi:butyrophilin subfamily 1 member A1-like [Sparus aurata]|uniref:butyrophilin subfamily 1 member A1-like n=1 Tax=Sparus aurata TaxID=8175 RepID=UPI0011C18AC2|nr:butyrophilin subfamily 1 member A1-like [Sparus aurata]